MFRKSVIVLVAIFCAFNLYAQTTEHSEKEIIFNRESSYYLSANSNGVGLGYRLGRNKTAFKIRTFDYSFSNIRDLKQIRVLSGYDNGKAYYYGKLNYFYIFRVVYGLQKTISSKPYWGGVEIRTLFLTGFNLGVAKPVYLNVLTGNSDIPVVVKKYEQDMLQQDIYGSAPYFEYGFDELKLHPGLSLKTGLSVEFGKETERVRAFEAGILIDGFLRPYQIMAFKQASYYNFSLYLTYHFGKRYNP